MAEAAFLTPLGWVASPLIKMLFDKAHHYLSTGIDEKRKILEATILPRLALAIEKAEKSTNKEKLVDWLKRLKGAYYEAEDAIDLFEYELLKKKVKDDRKTLVQKEKSKRGTRVRLQWITLQQKFKDRFPVFPQQKIKDCIDKIIEIVNEANEFCDLLEAKENCSSSEAGRETMSKSPDRVFGRDIDKENIVRLLTEKPSNSGSAITIVIKKIGEIIRVPMKKPLNYEPGPSTKPSMPIIAITGRSGVGKTALAQYVYKFMDEQNHFNISVWVHTPRKFEATDVMKNMIGIIKFKQHASNDSPSTSLEALSTNIRTMLGSKKLLLVLDDFWSDKDFFEQWEKFIGCLSSCSPGSKILLTTQSKNVAEKFPVVTEVKTYYLQEIEKEQFLELFMHYARHSNSHLQKEEFEKIGRKIVVKLKGDPSTAKLVGQQLREKNLRYWEEVAEKDCLGDNMKARIWSYERLPLNLQPCFAIWCIFPKGYRLSRKLLINFWMAEGLIRPIDNQERLEEIGEKYLDELVSMFFIEEGEFNKKKYYQLHDLLHDLAERVQRDDFIRIESTNSRESPSYISNMLPRSENIRHIFLPSSMINELKEKLRHMKNIRTFWVEYDGGIVPKNVLKKILKCLEKLRVLSLFNCVDDLPDSFGNLKHLRCLNIDGSQPLKRFPDSICKLYHLQTLVLTNCESLPKDFCELISLRKFNASRETLSHISRVGRLTSLQKLDHFVVRKECGYELQQLENLNQLRGEMYIAGLENVGSTEDAVKAHMQNKKYLEALTFEWNSDERVTDDVKLLEALQPQHNIIDLTLKGFGGDEFPNWIQSKNSLNHLTSLALMCCDKIEQTSSIVESLSNCKSLTLQRLKNLKEMSSLPPNLTYREIHDLPQLSYFSQDDLLINSKRSLEHTNQIGECLLELEWKVFLHRVHLANVQSQKEECNLILPSSLTILKISSCIITSDALSTCIKSLVSLSKLELSEIQTITSLPPKEVLCSLKNLQILIIRRCFLSSLGGIQAMSSLIELELNGCIMLDKSNDSLPSSLERLKFCVCANIEVLLAKSHLPVLRALDVGNVDLNNQMGALYDGVGWEGHLEGLNSLTALNTLLVKNFPEINLSFPLAKYASALPAVGVDNLLVLKLILSNKTIPSPENLIIHSLKGDSSYDEVFQSLTSLKSLYFIQCNITHLPKNLKNLVSLQYMRLIDCPNLCELELEELPKYIREMQIENCPILTEKFNKGGPYRVRFCKEKTIVTFPM